MGRLQLRKLATFALALGLFLGGRVIAQRLDGGVRLNGVTQGITINNPIFTGQALYATSTCAAPSIAWSGQLTTGLAFIGSNSIAGCANGSQTFGWDNQGIGFPSTFALRFMNGGSAFSTADAGLSRVSAGIVGVGNGTPGDVTATLRATSYLLASASNGMSVSGTSTQIKSADNGAYLVVDNGLVLVNSASLRMGAGGSALNAFLGNTTAKLVQLTDSALVTGTEFNQGTPTLGTCTAGSLTSGSHNQAGEITGNTSSSCVLNFGTPNWTNTPFCFAESETSLTHPRISAKSASSITITGGVSGEAIQYFCIGRIGT